MPALKWRYGYLAVWGLPPTTSLGMLAFFRHKGWIGRGSRAEHQR